jgi:glycosyltransferase involved in cell wall biosynthesis
MKILCWTPQFWPEIGGIEVLLLKSLPALQERGHEFLIITSTSELDAADRTQFNGMPVHRFPFWHALARSNFGQIKKIRQEISALRLTFQPDLVHLHYPGHIAYFHLHTAKVHPAPTLLTIHTPFPNARSEIDTLFGQTLRSADWVTAVSKATLADTIDSVPKLRERSSVIYNGLPRPRLLPSALQFDQPEILYLGRLAEEKGVDIALSAFAMLRNRFPGARLVIAGDGPVRSDLERQATELGLTDAVEFTGWIDPKRIPALINRSTLVVIPSRYREPFALIAVEAAQMGRPVVASKTGGLPETVANEETGLLFPNEDYTACADAIVALLENPAKAREMGKAGQARAAKLFTLERFVDAYDALYKKLTREGCAALAHCKN